MEGGAYSMDTIVGFILSMPREAWMMAICVVGIMGLIAIIKKAVKLGVLVVVLAVLFTYGGMAVRNIQAEYNIQVNGSVVSAVIDNEPLVVDFKEIESITVAKKGEDRVTLSVTSSDGLQANIDVPNVVYKITQAIAEEYGVIVKSIE